MHHWSRLSELLGFAILGYNWLRKTQTCSLYQLDINDKSVCEGVPSWTGQSCTLWNPPPAESATRSATFSNAYELASGVRSARNERHKRGEDLIVAALLGNPIDAAQQAAPRNAHRTARSTIRAPARMPAYTPPNVSNGGGASFLTGAASSGPSNSPSTSNAASTSNSSIRTIGQAFKQRLFDQRKNAELLGSVEASLREELERDMLDSSETATC